MEFTVYNRNGEGLFYTAYESCIPFEHLDSMASVGLLFYVDGKKLSASAVRSMFQATDTVELKSTKKFNKPKSLIPDTRSISVTPMTKIDFTQVDFPISSRCVVCLNTGKIYKNQSEAAKDLGLDPAYISDCVCHDKEYRGYRFKKAVDLQ